MAKPKLALIPAAQGDKFYSVLPSDGVGDFDFTRASTGTRIAPTGLIEEVASGDSRLNYDLLNGKVVNCPHYLLEPARTNVVQYSKDFTQLSSQSNVTISLNQIISPEGSLNASSFIDNSASGVHRAFTVYSSSIASGQLVSHSIFAKAKEHKWFQLSTGGNTNDQWANFDLENGIIGNSSSSANPIIENYGNGWYRCILFATTSANNASLAGLVTLTNNLDATSRSPSYSGSNKGVYVFGLQIEQGSYATSYIPTNGTAITRAAETANGSGDAATFNDSEGVLMAEISALADDLTFRLISLSDGTSNNRIYLGFNNTTNTIYLVSEVGGLTQVLITYAVTNITDFMKLAVKYKVNDYSLYFNGFEVATDTLGTVPIGLNSLQFNSGAGFSTFYGNTREVQYFDSALTDAQLETLTSWTSLQEMITSQLYTNY